MIAVTFEKGIGIESLEKFIQEVIPFYKREKSFIS
jgi:hypothetical protein